MLTREQKLVMLSTTLDMFLEGVFVTLSPISVQWPFVPGWAAPLLFIMMPIGTIIGNSTFGRLTDLRGRKLTYLSMLAVYAVGSALVILSSNVYELLAGLLIVYSAIGGEIPVVLSYVVESAPVDIKERVVVLITNVGNVGAVVAAALALMTSDVSVNAERLALGVLIGLAISVLVITRSLVPESRPWASLPRERRGRVSLNYESARFALASLTLMAISSVLTFGLLALSIGPEEFPERLQRDTPGVLHRRGPRRLHSRLPCHLRGQQGLHHGQLPRRARDHRGRDLRPQARACAVLSAPAG
jgi:Major Facilitator Superfamily.